MLIEKYGLQIHPEGGWYKQTYQSDAFIPQDCLPAGFTGARPFATAIYFLLEHGNFSAFHRIKSDECWHFYAGQALEIFILTADGSLTINRLGSDFENNEQFQFVVPANCWFASRPAAASEFCFVGCTVSPGFDFEEFELGTASELSATYPAHAEIIQQLSRQ